MLWDLARNLAADQLDALALTASSYTTGQSVTWVQKRDGCSQLRAGTKARPIAHSTLRVDHVMASSALPFFFPAIAVDGLGRPVVTWVESNGTDEVVFVYRYENNTWNKLGSPGASTGNAGAASSFQFLPSSSERCSLVPKWPCLRTA